MPTLGGTQGRRIPLVPRRRVGLDRNRLAWAAAFSAAVHIALIAAMIITFPNKPPQEAAAPQPGTVTRETILGARTDGANWLTTGRTYDEQRHSPLAQL